MTTTDPSARLDEIKARADAATEGPWGADDDDWDGCGVYVLDNGPGRAYVAQDMHQGEDEGVADAEFIAHARTDLPDMAAALTAVLDLHYPLNGPHEHLVCAHRHCIDDAGDQCRWPCMTARAITENLPQEDRRGE